LPDGIFSKQKYQFGQILEGLEMGTIGIFYGYLDHCVFNVHLVFLSSIGIFAPFWYIVPRKIWQPCLAAEWQKTLPKLRRQMKAIGNEKRVFQRRDWFFVSRFQGRTPNFSAMWIEHRNLAT
jgi:hypothetical protein